MKKDNNATATKKDLQEMEIRVRESTKKDLQELRAETRNDLQATEKKLTQSFSRDLQATESRLKNDMQAMETRLMQHFNVVAENLVHDFHGVFKDRLEQHEDRIVRLEQHAGLTRT